MQMCYVFGSICLILLCSCTCFLGYLMYTNGGTFVGEFLMGIRGKENVLEKSLNGIGDIGPGLFLPDGRFRLELISRQEISRRNL